MNRLLRLLRWAIKGTLFLTLFAFALNNQQEIRLNFFFGTYWQAPTVLVVLSAFALGVALGVLGMVPRWWRQRQVVRQTQARSNPSSPTPSVSVPPAPTSERSGGN